MLFATQYNLISQNGHGGCGFGTFWVGLENSRKLYIITTVQGLTISSDSVSVDSLHRFLLRMMITPSKAARKGSGFPPFLPHSLAPAFLGNRCSRESDGETWGAGRLGLAAGKSRGYHSHWVGWISLSPSFTDPVPEPRLPAAFLSPPLFVSLTCSLPWFLKDRTESSLRIFPMFYVPEASTQLWVFLKVFTADNNGKQESE